MPGTTRPSSRRSRARALLATVVAGGVAGAVAALGALAVPASAAGVVRTAPETDGPTRLHLVTLDGPGMAGLPAAESADALRRLRMWFAQDALLSSVDAPAPVYRWTSALNGVAVRLTDDQAEALAADPAVARVEPNQVRRLAARDDADPDLLSPGTRSRGGKGVVIGVVDSGLDPDGALFASVPELGKPVADFAGACQTGEDWDASDCTDKVASAHWFVTGFGRSALAAGATLSARDDQGHGTQVASVAAGNSDVTVRLDGTSRGRWAGVAPQARLAVYKACWSAPDPDDDGCATADLVAAIDRATAEGVDVLNVSVAGSSDLDTVGLALLGAAESGAVVVGAAGNDAPDTPAAHPGPWVTTVGAVADVRRSGVVRFGGRTVRGSSTAEDKVGPAPLVLARHAAASGASTADARVCAPRSLDPGLVRDAVVVCERGGGVGRVDKSATVAGADGAGMVLVDVEEAEDAAGGLPVDRHSVPTVHLDRADGRSLVAWAAANPRGEVSLLPRRARSVEPAVPAWSARGEASAAVLKPDVVAPGVGVLGAVPGGSWDFVSGTSVAAAQVSGLAARLLASRRWPATTVRSALSTTAGPVQGAEPASTGAGRVRASRLDSPGLVLPVDAGDYRRWLEGDLDTLNTPSVVLRGNASATRTLVNTARRARYFSVRTVGLEGRDVTVTPAALRLGPGESAEFTVSVGDTGREVQGAVVWRGATGTTTRIPVLLGR